MVFFHNIMWLNAHQVQPTLCARFSGDHVYSGFSGDHVYSGEIPEAVGNCCQRPPVTIAVR